MRQHERTMLTGIYVTISNGLVAILLSWMLGFSWSLFAQLFLATNLNVFMVPLWLFSSVPIPAPWVLYVILIEWASALLIFSRLDKKEVAENL